MSTKTKNDPINPDHYKNDSSGLECIQLAEHFNSGLLQQAFQYVWRAGNKDDVAQELKKALWFIGREHDLRAKGSVTRLQGHHQEGEEIFLEWRVKVRSNLRAAVLANLWRVDGSPSCHPTEFYTLCELVEAMRDGAR